MELILHNVRLSYPHLFKAKGFKGGDPKYSAAFIMDKVKDKATIAKVQAAIESVKAEHAAKKVDKDKVCLKDGGDKEEAYGDEVMYINSASDNRPQVIHRNRTPITEADNVIYGGCYVNAILNLWFQDNDFGRRVNASLEAVQFVGDGEAFGRKPVNVNEKLPDLSGEKDPMA
jgi:type II secretory pathway component PulC